MKEKKSYLKKGLLKGDNLAMSFYALSTVLMQQKLRSISTVLKVWLADDATAVQEK